PESVAEPQKYVTNNVTAARVLLETAVRARVRRFVFSSSCAVYGHPATIPITEDAPQRPVNPYGETKRDFEQLLVEAGPPRGMGVVSLRYFNASGATDVRGEDHDPETHLIPNVLAAALGKRRLEIYGTDYPTRDGARMAGFAFQSGGDFGECLALASASPPRLPRRLGCSYRFEERSPRHRGSWCSPPAERRSLFSQSWRCFRWCRGT